MVNTGHLYKTDNKALKIDYLFYFASILLAASVFSYLILNFKVHLQNQRLEEIEKKSLSLGTGERQIYNKKVLDYKKKIDDFAVLFGSHKITLNVFSFIEEKTLSNVWFSNFNMQKDTNVIKLSGESENIEVLSRQVRVFEESHDHVKNIEVLSSQTNSTGKIEFVLNILLNHQIFSYGQILEGANY